MLYDHQNVYDLFDETYHVRVDLLSDLHNTYYNL